MGDLLRGAMVASAFAMVTVEGCSQPTSFACQSDGQCPGGACEPNGWCSFPDPQCGSGARYGDHAGDGEASLCVPGGGSTGAMGVGQSDGSDGAPTGGGAGSGMEGPVCGDGIVESDEQCDDGNNTNADGCNIDCQPSASVRWSATYDGEAGMSDLAYAAVLRGQDVVVAGTTTTAAGGRDGLVLRLRGGDGSVVFARANSVALGSEDDTYLAAAPVGSTDMIVAGEVFETQLNIAVSRLGGDGAVVWSTWVAPGRARGVVVDGDSVWVAGRIDDAGVVTPSRQNWVGLLSLDGALVQEWVSTAMAAEQLHSIAVLDAGAVVAVGERDPAAGGKDGLVVSVSASLVDLLSWTPPGAYAVFQSVVPIESDILVAGFDVEEAADTLQRVALVGRFTAAGDAVWSRRYDHAGFSDEIEALAVDGVGDVVAAGFVSKDVPGNAEAFVRKFSPAGDERWTWTSDPSPGDDVLRAVAIAPDDDIFIAGETAPDGDAIEDVWVARLAP